MTNAAASRGAPHNSAEVGSARRRAGRQPMHASVSSRQERRAGAPRASVAAAGGARHAPAAGGGQPGRGSRRTWPDGPFGSVIVGSNARMASDGQAEPVGDRRQHVARPHDVQGAGRGVGARLEARERVAPEIEDLPDDDRPRGVELGIEREDGRTVSR